MGHLGRVPVRSGPITDGVRRTEKVASTGGARPGGRLLGGGSGPGHATGRADGPSGLASAQAGQPTPIPQQITVLATAFRCPYRCLKSSWRSSPAKFPNCSARPSTHRSGAGLVLRFLSTELGPLVRCNASSGHPF